MMSDRPERVQRKRVRGYRMPPNCVSVVRPGIFGNPFTVAKYLAERDPKATPAQAAEGCVRLFREWLAVDSAAEPERRARLLRWLPELRGKHLACYCPLGAPCHASVLLELANGGAGR